MRNQPGRFHRSPTVPGTTMEAPVYLDLVTRGPLWACGKLDDSGKPKAGYGSKH